MRNRKMNRRRFLLRSSAFAASSLVGLDLFSQAARADGCGGPPPGVQLFTVREALGRDPRAALRQLREIGIVEAELYGLNGPDSATLYGLPVRELKRAFDDNGIRCRLRTSAATSRTPQRSATSHVRSASNR